MFIGKSTVFDFGFIVFAFIHVTNMFDDMFRLICDSCFSFLGKFREMASFPIHVKVSHIFFPV